MSSKGEYAGDFNKCQVLMYNLQFLHYLLRFRAEVDHDG